MIIAYPPLDVKFPPVHKKIPPLMHEKKRYRNINIACCHLIKVLAYQHGIRYDKSYL